MSNYDASNSVFGDLYDYSEAGGKVTRIPDFPTLRRNVADGFVQIFGQDFVTDPETPNGLLVDAIATTMFDTLGIVAQNLNGLNIDLAAGQYLDALGGIFGVAREGDNDDDYRRRILASQSRGSGTVYSVRQALSKLTCIDGFCVLENNTPVGRAAPEGQSAGQITLSPHSIYVCIIPKSYEIGDDGKPVVAPYEDEDGNEIDPVQETVNAVYETKAPGCAYTTQEDHDITSEVTDDETGSVNSVTINVSTEKTSVAMEIEIDPLSYSGGSMSADVMKAVRTLLGSRRIASVITKAQIAGAVSEYAHAVAKKVTIKVGGTASDELVIYPYEHIVPDHVAITVS